MLSKSIVQHSQVPRAGGTQRSPQLRLIVNSVHWSNQMDIAEQLYTLLAFLTACFLVPGTIVLYAGKFTYTNTFQLTYSLYGTTAL